MRTHTSIEYPLHLNYSFSSFLNILELSCIPREVDSVLVLLRLSGTPRETDSDLVLLVQAVIWFTCLFGLWGQFTAICPGPLQYKHSRFALRRCFSSSDSGPRRRVVSISIGVGVFVGDALYGSLGKGFATTCQDRERERVREREREIIERELIY